MSRLEIPLNFLAPDQWEPKGSGTLPCGEGCCGVVLVHVTRGYVQNVPVWVCKTPAC